MEDRPVLVLGGTGHYGRHIVRSLLAKGEGVRVLSRDADKARQVLGPEVELIEGDITDREVVLDSLMGAKAMVIAVSAFTPALVKKLRLIELDSVLTVLEEAKKAHVARVVYISVYDIREEFIEKFNLASGRIKLEVEKSLIESGLNWTVLGAAPSMKIYFKMLNGNKMMVPGGGMSPLPTISPQDLGEIAAQTVLRDDLSGQRLRLTGPEALSFTEAAGRMEKVAGKPITVGKIPLWPIKAAALASKPFSPYLYSLVGYIQLMNAFPQDILAEVQRDHQRLRDLFNYDVTTIEREAANRLNGEDH